MPTKRNNPRHSANSRPVPEARALSRSRSGRKRPVTVSNVEASARGTERVRAARHGAAHSALVDARRKRSRKRVLSLVLIVCAVALVAAAAVTAFTFFRSTDSNLSLEPSNAKEALVAQKTDEPYYVLMTADLAREGYGAQQPDAQGMLLVRIDEGSKTVTLCTIPAKLNVRTSDGNNRPLDEARSVGGDAELIRCVASLAEVDISHFVTTDSAGIVGMTDAMGGVSMDLESKVDDPHAGTLVVSAGNRPLSGEEALMFLRASNVNGGTDGMYANRMAFTFNLAEQAATSEGLDFAGQVGEASRFIYTDWTASDLLALGGVLKPVEEITLYQCVVPYMRSNAAGPDVVLYERQPKSWAAMLERLKAGEDPNQIESSAESVEAAAVSVEVRNGTNTAGAAAKLGEMLTGQGFNVIGVGNTDDGTIYPETLVIYTKSGSEGEAKAVLRAMGSGRVVEGGDFYSSEADVIAIIGLDWMPVE